VLWRAKRRVHKRWRRLETKRWQSKKKEGESGKLETARKQKARECRPIFSLQFGHAMA